MVIQKEDNSQ